MRWKDVLVGAVTYALARRLPGLVRRAIIDGVRKGLGPGHDVEKDFTPAYNPWDQRICLIPDGDLFAAIRSGRVSIATDTIGTFTETGITLTSGSELKAEIVVLATGLVVRLMGGMEIVVDGAPFDPADRLVYKGMMLSGVPNLALAFGYINASWTLRCDLTARTLCRLLRHMDRRGYAMCAPRHPGSRTSSRPLLNFTSGYVRRAEGVLPRQGLRPPWRVHQNHLFDMMALRFGPIEDGVLEFEAASAEFQPGEAA
jgi:cation diffusion facilitator CzcD-associated flavoprotein CzcO